ncbi:MAG: GNAT family N-acetyltransferase [Candidatus Bathyarchaeia archaeon]
MSIAKETLGQQTLYRLMDPRLGHTLGKATISETAEGIRLHTIYVEPEHRGKGYGDTIMKTILKGVKDKPMTLCTCFGNVPFFKRYDFEVTEIGESLVFMERKPNTT